MYGYRNLTYQGIEYKFRVTVLTSGDADLVQSLNVHAANLDEAIDFAIDYYQWFGYVVIAIQHEGHTVWTASSAIDP